MIKTIFKAIVYCLGLFTLIGILASACVDEEVKTEQIETNNDVTMIVPEEPDSEVKIVPAEPEETEETLNSFVIADNELVKVSVIDAYEDTTWGEVGFEVEIVNKTDMTLMVAVDDVSVNGVMNDPFWATEVAAGKTAYSNIGWYINSDSNKNVKSLSDINNIEFTLRAYDSNDMIDGVRVEEYIVLGQ